MVQDTLKLVPSCGDFEHCQVGMLVAKPFLLLAAGGRAVRTDLTGVHLRITSVHDGDGQYINMLTPDLTAVTNSSEWTGFFPDMIAAVAAHAGAPPCRTSFLQGEETSSRAPLTLSFQVSRIRSTRRAATGAGVGRATRPR